LARFFPKKHRLSESLFKCFLVLRARYETERKKAYGRHKENDRSGVRVQWARDDLFVGEEPFRGWQCPIFNLDQVLAFRH
jgi:hypothetical protein